jgi:membrane protein YdbS with pleckstrin-like domain
MNKLSSRTTTIILAVCGVWIPSIIVMISILYAKDIDSTSWAMWSMLIYVAYFMVFMVWLKQKELI